MTNNKPTITAKTVEEFQQLLSEFEKLPPKVKECIESMQYIFETPNYVLKTRVSNDLGVIVPEDIQTIEFENKFVKVYTKHGTFLSEVSEKGFKIKVYPFLK